MCLEKVTLKNGYSQELIKKYFIKIFANMIVI